MIYYTIRISNKDKFKNLVIILEVITIFTTIIDKNVKYKLKVNKLLKISILSNIDIFVDKKRYKIIK